MANNDRIRINRMPGVTEFEETELLIDPGLYWNIPIDEPNTVKTVKVVGACQTPEAATRTRKLLPAPTENEA